MHPFLIAAWAHWLSDSKFMGKVLEEWVSDTQQFVSVKLPHLAVVAIIAFVLIRLLGLFASRMIRVAEQHAAGQGRVAQVKTLVGVIRTTGFAIISAIVGLQFLDAVGINLAPLLASAGIAGVAIGLAAQNLVKDMLNGTLILIEDQFNVGDVVTLAGLTGTVELMTLRKTTVRGNDGTLYVIPNSQITTVANQSAYFSVATINVSVDFSANPDKVLELLKGIAMGIRTSPDFKDLFLADPQILGVDAIRGSQLIFPVVFRTLATKQYAPMREFHRRVWAALEENHLLPGDANRVFNSFIDPETGQQPVPSTSARIGSVDQKLTPAPDPTTIKPEESNPFAGN
jgi:small conductance mechanosensitive channel